MLLEEWLNKEVSFGDLGDVSLVQKKAPRKIKRKRPIPTEDGSTLGYDPLFCSFILALFFHNGCLCIFFCEKVAFAFLALGINGVGL
jgi:hypothetical protein